MWFQVQYKYKRKSTKSTDHSRRSNNLSTTILTSATNKNKCNDLIILQCL